MLVHVFHAAAFGVHRARAQAAAAFAALHCFTGLVTLAAAEPRGSEAVAGAEDDTVEAFDAGAVGEFCGRLVGVEPNKRTVDLDTAVLGTGTGDQIFSSTAD